MHINEKKQRNDLLIKELCNDPNYRIFKNGSIHTLITRTGKKSAQGIWRKLTIMSDKDGYQRVRYNVKYFGLHRIIFQKFIGALDCTKEINHIDGNPANNSVENLEQVTKCENAQHSYRVLNRKPNYGKCKLNQELADQIRAMTLPYKEIAKLFGVSVQTIKEVRINKTWKNSPLPKSEAV